MRVGEHSDLCRFTGFQQSGLNARNIPHDPVMSLDLGLFTVLPAAQDFLLRKVPFPQ